MQIVVNVNQDLQSLIAREFIVGLNLTSPTVHEAVGINSDLDLTNSTVGNMEAEDHIKNE